MRQRAAATRRTVRRARTLGTATGLRAILLTLVAVLVATASVTACGPSRDSSDLRQWTDDLSLRISTDPIPPRAREPVLFKVVVQDRESRQPIERGEGRIFATSRDGASIWDSLQPGPEPGAYYGSLNFITSGDWAVAIQFRRDSTQRLARVDWMQTIRSASE